MSDTPSELADHRGFVYKAIGRILINGLGLGMIICNLLEKSDVMSITVNEISEDVIKLVSDFYLRDKRVKINHADAFTWKPDNGDQYDAVWHDIWGNISTDCLKEMTKLKRRYARWIAKGGFQECWKHDWLKWKARQERSRRGW